VGTTLNKDAYKKLIKEDMEKVEKYFPEHSLEKKHIQEVLRSSIECYYPSEGKKKLDTDSNCNIPLVSNCTTCKFTDAIYEDEKCCKCDRTYSMWEQR